MSSVDCCFRWRGTRKPERDGARRGRRNFQQKIICDRVPTKQESRLAGTSRGRKYLGFYERSEIKYLVTRDRVLITFMQKPKLIVILGPTATGKSALAVRLAKHIGGEVISADSRQVYRGMDIGTGKITKKEMRGVPHHLLDVASPKQQYSVARFVRDAKKAAVDIHKKKRIPIIVGGTGLYIDALSRGTSLPEVPPNLNLRAQLEKLTTEKLFALLKKKDSRRAHTIDRHNRRRLIRALEIVELLGKVPPAQTRSDFETLFIGLTLPQEQLRKKIHRRLSARMSRGMVAEVRKLHKNGVSWKKLEEFGLEYRNIAQYLQKKIPKQEMLLRLTKDIKHYAKRQMTWFKRHPDIHWFSLSDFEKIKVLSKKFLHS